MRAALLLLLLSEEQRNAPGDFADADHLRVRLHKLQQREGTRVAKLVAGQVQERNHGVRRRVPAGPVGLAIALQCAEECAHGPVSEVVAGKVHRRDRAVDL